MPNKLSMFLATLSANRSLPRSVTLVADMWELNPKNIPAHGRQQCIDVAPLDTKFLCPLSFITI